MSGDGLDCVGIGGGPAGLTAAIYLARYRRRVVVLDASYSRAALIPHTRNYPGFAHGVCGKDLLATRVEQARSYGVIIVRSEAQTLTKTGERFHVTAKEGEFSGPRVVMATAIVAFRTIFAKKESGTWAIGTLGVPAR